jgi:ribosomal protein S21
MVEFKRKKGETFESFLRRFNKRLQQSGSLYDARKNRYHQKSKNESAKKKSALIGLELRHKKEYQRRTGKLKDDLMNHW